MVTLQFTPFKNNRGTSCQRVFKMQYAVFLIIHGKGSRSIYCQMDCWRSRRVGGHYRLLKYSRPFPSNLQQDLTCKLPRSQVLLWLHTAPFFHPVTVYTLVRNDCFPNTATQTNPRWPTSRTKKPLSVKHVFFPLKPPNLPSPSWLSDERGPYDVVINSQGSEVKQNINISCTSYSAEFRPFLPL